MELRLKLEDFEAFCERYMEYIKKSSPDYFNSGLTPEQDEAFIHGVGFVGGYITGTGEKLIKGFPNSELLHINTTTSPAYGVNVYVPHSEGNIATVNFDNTTDPKMIDYDKKSFYEGKKFAIMALEEFGRTLGVQL